MGRMLAYIKNPTHVKSLNDLLLNELETNLSELTRRNWLEADKKNCRDALEKEKAELSLFPNATQYPSVKGETAINDCYFPHRGNQIKAPDIITLKENDTLQLIELKFALKVGNLTIFTKKDKFKERISDKFLETINQLTNDNETVSSLRILVISKKQYDVGMIRLNYILTEYQNSEISGYSSDNVKYNYCLCTPKSLGTIINTPEKLSQLSKDDCYLFKL